MNAARTPHAEALVAESADPASADARALVAAMEAEIERLYAGREGSIRDITARPEEMSPPNGGFVVIREGGLALAGGGFKLIGDGVCEVKRMYVRPEHRGRGLGAVLLGAIEDAARAAGVRVARLDTGDDQPAAERLYDGAGYRRIPDYNGNRVARHWFEKELDR